MNQTRLFHIGSAVVDFVYRIADLPAAGTERTARSFAMLAGGGFNMMLAARRTGLHVAYAGKHGAGHYGTFLRQAFAENGIDVLLPPTEGIDSGNCVAMITDDAERTFVSWPGAESFTTAADLSRIDVGAGDWVFISGYTLSYPGSRVALADWIAALPQPIPFAFDPTPVVGDIPKDILARVLDRTTWLSCNLAEATVIAGRATVAEQADALLTRHCRTASGVVIRAGAKGSFLKLRGADLLPVPGFKVEAIDTNGAGDTHIGAFISALARGEAPVDAVVYANAAAAISVTRPGGSSAPDHDEITLFLRNHAPETA